MDPDSVRSTLSNLVVENVMGAAARDYKKELLVQQKVRASTSVDEELDLDELIDDPEIEKLHAERIANLKREVEKRQSLKKLGHGEYREISEEEFLGEVTGSKKAICHFYHREFFRCKIMDKHLKALAPRHTESKFIKLDVENAPFFVHKLAIKTLPCVIFFRDGVAVGRLIGFQDLSGNDDFTTGTLETLLVHKAMINKQKSDDDDEDSDDSSLHNQRTVRSSAAPYSDSD